MFIRNIVLCVTLINIVLCIEVDEDDILVNVHEPRKLTTFAYNHPPFFESSDSHILKVRQANGLSKQKFTETIEDGILFEHNLEPIQSILRTKRSRSPNIREDSTQIPVTVVYEDQSNVNIKPVSKPTGNKIRRRKQRKQQGSNQKQSINSEQNFSETNKRIQDITITTTTTLPAPTVKTTHPPNRDVTIFPKRPIEDSKRIEFQRRSRTHPPFVKILDEQNFVYAHNGNFHYSYDSADGTKISSRGELLKNDKNEGTGEAVVGSVSYKDDEGHDFNLSYTADENGYRPVGDHLPTPPPIPPAIARALKYLATKMPETTTEVVKKIKP